MRGKPPLALFAGVLQRNIPAYVGKTASSTTTVSPGEEHPRVCGENAGETAGAKLGGGTSPRMRGKQGHDEVVTMALGNIPAYAGKIWSDRIGVTVISEHPRVCGENGTALERRILGSGTSPRMRGKYRWDAHHISLGRNIPAYAGKIICYGSST